MAILVATDFSHPVRKTVEFAAGLARAVGERVWLTLVQEQAANEPLVCGSDLAQVASQKEHAQLYEASEALRAQGILVETRLIRGSIVESLVAMAYELHARFVVVGTQESGALRQIVTNWGHHVGPHPALQVGADVWVLQFETLERPGGLESMVKALSEIDHAEREAEDPRRRRHRQQPGPRTSNA